MVTEVASVPLSGGESYHQSFLLHIDPTQLIDKGNVNVYKTGKITCACAIFHSGFCLLL